MADVYKRQPRHVFGKVEYDSDVAALSGERGATAAAEKRRAEFAAERDRGHDIFGVAWEHYPDRDLAVVAAIGGVERARTAVEPDIFVRAATKPRTQGIG